MQLWHNPRCSKSRAAKALLDARERGLRELPRDRADWLELLVANPVLIERPILLTDDGRAALGRPIEAIEAVL